MKYLTGLGCYLFFLLVSGAGPVYAESVLWQDWKTGLNLARQKQRPIYVFIKSDHCPHCVKMEKETLLNPGVADTLNRDFIPVLIDADQDRPLIKKLGCKGYPDSRFLSPDEKTIFQFYGFQGPDVFAIFLKYVASGSYETMDVMAYFKSGKWKNRAGPKE